MWFYIPAVIVILVIGIWVSRTNLYRAHRRKGKNPGQAGWHAEGSMLNADSAFRKND